MPGNVSTYFLDTNILLYNVAGPPEKFEIARQLVLQGGIISVQVLGEFTAVTRQKFGLSWPDVRDLLVQVRDLFTVVDVTTQTHETAIEFAERFNLAFHDAGIAAAAHLAGCNILYSENMHHGLQLTPNLQLQNPFT